MKNRDLAQSAKSVESTLVISEMLMSQPDHTQNYKDNGLHSNRKDVNSTVWFRQYGN